MDEKELQRLYEAMSKRFDIGDYDTFKSKMATPEDRKKFYDVVGSKGYDLGDYNAYEQRIGTPVKKKENWVTKLAGGSEKPFAGAATAGSAFGAKRQESETPSISEIDYDKLPKRGDAGQPFKANANVTSLLPKTKDAGVTQMKGYKHSSGIEQGASEEKITEDAHSLLNEIMYADDERWRDPIKSVAQSALPKSGSVSNAELLDKATTKKRAMDITNQSLMPDGYEAKRVLLSSQFKDMGDDNFTAKALREKAAEYDKNVEPLRQIQIDGDPDKMDSQALSFFFKNDIDNAAIKYYAANNPDFERQLRDSGIDINDKALADKIPNAKRGQILSMFLNNPDVGAYVQKENPKLLPALENAFENNITDNIDFGVNVVANKVSRAVQESGFNDIDRIFNFYGKNHKEYADIIAKRVLSPKELAIWDAKVKDNQEKYMDAPSFFEGVASSSKSFVKGLANTFTEPFTPLNETIKKKWEDEATNVSADPKGFSKFLRDSGHAVGIVLPIAATGGVVGGITRLNPQSANALGVALGFFGDQLEEARYKYSDSPVKALTAATFNTALYSALSYNWTNAVKGTAAFKRFQPAMNKVAENLTSGGITREVARRQSNDILMRAINFVGGTTKTSAKIAAELTGIEVMNKMLDKVMGLDQQTFDKYHPEGAEADTFKTMFLSNLMLGGMLQYGKMRKGNMVAQESLYEAATNPLRYERMIEEMKVKDPSIDATEMLSNLKFITETKKQLDQLGVSPKNQARYLFEAIKDKVHSENLKKSPESNITRRSQEEIRGFQEVKEKILEGEDAENIVTEAEVKEQEAQAKEAAEKTKAEAEILNLNKSRELDHKEVDIQLKELDKQSPTYSVKKEKLELKKKEIDEYYDEKINKLSQDTGAMTPEKAELLKQAEKAVDEYVVDYMQDALKADLETALRECAEQLNSTPSEAKTARRFYGDKFSDIALKMFPDAKPKIDPTGELAQLNERLNAEAEADAQPAENKSAASVILPGEIPNRETITISPKEKATNEVEQPITEGNEQVTAGKEGAANEAPPEPPKPPTEGPKEPTIGGNEGGTPPPIGEITEAQQKSISDGITHAANEVRRKERNMPEYEKTPETFEAWNKKAEELLKDGYDVDALIDRIKDGHDPTPVENAIRKIYVATLDAEIMKNPTNELLARQKKFVEAGDLANSRAGRNLVSLKGEGSPLESISDFYVAKMEAVGADILTESQKRDVQKQFEEIKKAKEEAEAKLKEYESRGMEAEAKKELDKQVKSTKRKNNSPEEFQRERQSLKEQLKAAREEHQQWLKDQGIQQAGFGSFTGKEAKIVAQIVKSYVEQGIVKLEAVVEKVFEEIKDILPNATKEDIRDVIAGKYNERKQTRSELEAAMRDLKDEQVYINKLEALLNGDEPKNERKKVKRNQEITDLQNKIKEFKKEDKDANTFSGENKPDNVKKLEAIKKRNETQAEKIKEKIKAGDFEKKEKKPFLEDPKLQKQFPEAYKKALDAIVAREKAQHEFDIALMKDQMAKRGLGKKSIDLLGDIVGTTRALVTGIDASGIGIQNLLAMVAHPRSAAKALPASFVDFASAKTQDRWLAKVHNSKLYPLSEKAGLDITEPASLKSTAKEEIFTHNLLDRGIKYKGKTYIISKYTTKPFERIFTGLGNRMRWNLWERGVEKLFNEGYTWEAHPEQFKSLAKILNTETGRGGLHGQVNKAYDAVSTGIWSPRLMASRLNILGLGDLGNLVAGGKKGYYGGLTPKMRAYAIADVAKFIVFGTASLGLAGLTFADDVDIDPTSTTFGTFMKDGKRYNIFGGFTQYVRLVSKLVLGGENQQGKFTASNQDKTILRFLWSKTTPAMGTVVSSLRGRDYMGKPITFMSELEKLTVPLSIRGVVKGVRAEGASSALWTGLPSFVGVNVGYESDFQRDDGFTKEDASDKTFKFFLDKGVELPEVDTDQIKVDDKDGKTIKKLSEYEKSEIEKFIAARKKYLKEELQALKDGDVILYVDSYGRVSTTDDDPDREKEEIELSKLTKEQLKDILGTLGSKATKLAKTEVFGEE